MKIHNLKIKKEYLDAILSGLKTWEIRDHTNRDFNVGDQLFLREWGGKNYTGPSILVNVTYLMQASNHYTIMSIVPVKPLECVH
jgi:hypothetical protein